MNLGIIDLLKESANDRKALNSLIENCFKIAVHYAQVNSKKVFRQLTNETESVVDIAIDSIAPLFLSNSQNELQISRIFRKWGNKINSEQDALYFLNRIVSKRVNQRITHILKESDPFFAKIYDSVGYLIKKNGFKKQNYFGTVFIVEKKIKYSVIDNDTFNSLPVELFISQDKMIYNLLNYIENETEYFPAIPVNTLVNKIKHISFEGYFEANESTNHLLNYELKESVNLGLNNAMQKLYYSYIENKKLTESEIQSFENTLNDIAFDLKNGGLKPGLYDYLKINMPELKKELFHLKYQNILEYLLKIMKKRVAAELKK